MLVFNRARPLVTLMVLVVLVATGLAFAVPARAASDMSGPVLLSSSVTPTTFNLHDGPATVKITIRLVDATGVQSPTMIASWVDPNPWGWVYGGGQSQGFGSMRLVSGTMQDGIWEHTITIPQGAATGKWEVTLYPLRDTWGNSSSFFKTLATITVTDAAPPTAVSPAAVTFTDKDGTKYDTYTVPATTGVEYLMDGKVVSARSYPGTGTVTVTAKAGTGYVLAPKAASSWTATFKGFLVGPAPTISGSAQVGSSLTANPGTWGPAPVALGYQWYRSGVAIAGANAGTYTPTVTDAAATLTVKVTGSKSGYTAFSTASAPTAAVAKGSLTRSTPIITGTAKIGATLTVNPGTWGPAPVTLRFQWYRSGVAVSGATAPTYKPTSTDVAKTLTVRVTGSKAGYTTFFRTSPSTAVIAK